MRRKTTFLLSLLLTIALGVSAQTSEPRHEILLETDSGNVRIALYNETPQHRDNILRLVEAHAYDGVLFHRVISNFMVQTGDLGSIGAPQGKLLGDTPEKYSVPAEIRFPQLFHKRGVVAAAREGDDVNPERRSSATQFYIVWGRQWDDASLDKLQQRIDQMTQGTVKLTPEIREVYKTLGGTPPTSTALIRSLARSWRDWRSWNVSRRLPPMTTTARWKDIRVVRATVVK